MHSPKPVSDAPDGRRFGIASPSILRPIRVRLTLVFVVFFTVGGWRRRFQYRPIGEFPQRICADQRALASEQPNSGDLNNYISDYRAAEGDFLIASSRADLRAADEQVAMLDKLIATSQARYDKIEHDSAEHELYSQFVTQWNTYRELAKRLMITAKAGDVAGGTRLYHTDSKHAFDLANDTLGVMTERSVAGAAAETEREAQAYHDARQLIIGAIVVAAWLVVLAVIYLVYAVSRPIAALVDRMHHIANNDTRIDIPGLERHDEIGDIAQAVARFREKHNRIGTQQGCTDCPSRRIAGDARQGASHGRAAAQFRLNGFA